jgi:hypothetical protein
MFKKCAICFSGQVRTAERSSVKDNLEINLIEPLLREGYQIYYFACAERYYGNYIWHGFKEAEDKNYWGYDIDLYDARLGPGVKGGSFNVMNQWKKCQEVAFLKQRFEKENNLKFDLVFRIRPDMVLQNKLEYSSLDLTKYNIPNHDNWYGYNDRAGAGNSKNMDYYMINFVNNIEKYFKKDGIIFHSETLLKHHLDQKNIEINRPNFNVLFEREEGTDYGNIYFN